MCVCTFDCFANTCGMKAGSLDRPPHNLMGTLQNHFLFTSEQHLTFADSSPTSCLKFSRCNAYVYVMYIKFKTQNCQCKRTVTMGWDINWLLQTFVFCEVDLVLYSLISIYTLQWSPHTKYKLSKQVPRIVNSACSFSPSQD